MHQVEAHHFRTHDKSTQHYMVGHIERTNSMKEKHHVFHESTELCVALVAPDAK